MGPALLCCYMIRTRVKFPETHLQLEENLLLSRCCSIWFCLSLCTQTCTKYAESHWGEQACYFAPGCCENKLFQGHLQPPEGKGVNWVVWKLLQRGQRVVLLKARKQVHTMSFLSGPRVSIGGQTRAALLLINFVFHSTISCLLTPPAFPLSAQACYSDLIIVSEWEGWWKKEPEQDLAFPTSPKLPFLLEINWMGVLHFLRKINVSQV